MTSRDIIAFIVLILAYLITWILFLKSLKIVDIIDREKLKHLNEIRGCLNEGTAYESPYEDDK